MLVRTVAFTTLSHGDLQILVRPSLLTASVVVHTLGYLLMTALVAMLVYEKFGVGVLRHAWFNVDLIWMVALMITGVLILFL